MYADNVQMFSFLLVLGTYGPEPRECEDNIDFAVENCMKVRLIELKFTKYIFDIKYSGTREV
jgi:hypothetical protein